HTAENVPRTYGHADLNTHGDRIFDVRSDAGDGFLVQTELIRAHQNLAGHFEQNSLVTRGRIDFLGGHGHKGLLVIKLRPHHTETAPICLLSSYFFHYSTHPQKKAVPRLFGCLWVISLVQNPASIGFIAQKRAAAAASNSIVISIYRSASDSIRI